MIIAYTTCKDKKEAEKIANFILKGKFAACANYFPINSIYFWNGKKCKDKEFALLLKTTSKNFEKIKKEIMKIHSYDTPCILKIKADANKEYDAWVKASVN